MLCRLLEAELNSHHKRTAKYTDWLEEREVEKEASAWILKAKDRSLGPLVKFAFKCRHDKLRTAEHQWNRVKDIKDLSAAPEWMKKIQKNFQSPKCPFGCDAVENIDHLVTCPAGKKTHLTLVKDLKEMGFAYVSEWLSSSELDNWKAKWTWMGIFPRKLIEIIQQHCEGQTQEHVKEKIQRLQTTLLSGLRELWVNRCKKLFSKSEAEKQQEKEQLTESAET